MGARWGAEMSYWITETNRRDPENRAGAAAARMSRKMPRHTNKTRISLCLVSTKERFPGLDYIAKNGPSRPNRFNHFQLYFGGTLGCLTDERVHTLRTANLPDRHFERLWHIHAQTVRRARIGQTWRDHPTPPDIKPRVSQGNWNAEIPTASHP
jgi:hypothetical protein